MGVQGLLPFLRKVSPNAFQRLTNRFEDIRETRLIIDGTLITQRFHFAPSPHPHRHVLRWYRLAEEMRRSNVTAICIFDGQGRHSAKQKEVLRRRKNQKIAVVRSQIESARLHRLVFLKNFLCSIPTLPLTDLKPTCEYLLSLGSMDGGDQGVQEALQALNSQASDRALSKLAGEETGPASAEQLISTTEATNKFRETVAPLYKEYKHSISQLFSIIKQDAGKMPVIQDAEKELESIMTRAQSQLTIMEKNIWGGLLSLPEDDTQSWEALATECAELAEQSYKMSNSFDRRINTPTSDTFKQSQQILEAMGIRCIMAEGEVEAEGLASSMVLNGQADFVASEDTDVLVYGASLLRNLTGTDALELLSAKDIQSNLEINHQTFVDFAILLGTDFSQRPKNVGPIRALKFIKQYGCIEKILQSQPTYPPHNSKEEYLLEVEAARSIFNSRPATKTLNPIPLPLDDAAVSSILTHYGFHRRELVDLSSWNIEDRLSSGSYFSDIPTAL